MKVLIIGDLHFREIYPYASHFEDRRLDERKEIEDAIVNASKDCDKIVLMGDVLDSRNNSAKTIKNLTTFIERFDKKQVVIMSGNHDSFANGDSALDFLGEVSGKNWILVTDSIVTIDDLKFVPYFRKSQLGKESDSEVVEWVLNEVTQTGGRAIFLHHCLSGTKNTWGQLADTFHEPVFASESLCKRFQRVFGAHIHNAQDKGNLHVLGSVMNNEVGDHSDKRIIKWDTETDTVESINLPGRKFYKIVNPTHEQVDKLLGTNETLRGLVRVVADEIDESLIEKLHKAVEGEVITVELPKENRKRVKDDIDDYSLDNLIKIYSEIKEVSLIDLKRGLELIEE